MSETAESARSTRISPARMTGLTALGFATDFLDTLGVGSFATTTAVLRLGRLVQDEQIPGTLNVGHAIPTFLEAALFLTAIPVDRVTLVLMVVMGGLGAWFGTGVVVRLPRRKIQQAMAISLLVTAAIIVLRQSNVFPTGGEASGLSGWRLIVAVIAAGVIGSLTSLGIGNYAPTMAVTYMLGMSPKAVFPIMACSAAVILPAAAIRFLRSGRFDRATVLGLAIGGIPGVLAAVYLVKELNVKALLWVVAAVLVYTSFGLYRASLNSQVDPQDAKPATS